MAGGTAEAVVRPISALITSSVRPSLQKPAASEKTAKRNMLLIKSHRLPVRSASLPKNNKNVPPESEDDADIHVISAVVI